MSKKLDKVIDFTIEHKVIESLIEAALLVSCVYTSVIYVILNAVNILVGSHKDLSYWEMVQVACAIEITLVCVGVLVLRYTPKVENKVEGIEWLAASDEGDIYGCRGDYRFDIMKSTAGVYFLSIFNLVDNTQVSYKRYESYENAKAAAENFVG